jgi:hypothetical protein
VTARISNPVQWTLLCCKQQPRLLGGPCCCRNCYQYCFLLSSRHNTADDRTSSLSGVKQPSRIIVITGSVIIPSCALCAAVPCMQAAMDVTCAFRATCRRQVQQLLRLIDLLPGAALVAAVHVFAAFQQRLARECRALNVMYDMVGGVPGSGQRVQANVSRNAAVLRSTHRRGYGLFGTELYCWQYCRGTAGGAEECTAEI